MMTSDTLHDLDPTFEWKPTYAAQLQHIADTDEFHHEDGQQQFFSSSASGSSHTTQPLQHPGAYDWPTLKDAIKYRIRACLHENFGQDRDLDLHPAVKLMPYLQRGLTIRQTRMNADDGLLVQYGSLPEQTEKTEDSAATAQISPVIAMEASEAEPASGAETELATNSSQSNGSTGPTAEEASSLSVASEEPVYAYRSRLTNEPGMDFDRDGRPCIHPPFVSEADAQGFYPSKRPSTSTTVSPLSAEEVVKQTRVLFSMLDDFDVQPPFTIQRLCELIVSPTTHYNSGAKWIAALKRCLSVTATRDAFPISPVQAPVGVVGVNGQHEESNQSDMSEVDMDRMDGLPPSSVSVGGRSRSSSVGSNANSEPLFSPIPFIVRDEMGQLTHAVGANGQLEQGKETVGETSLMEPIPDLELGGADRTQTMHITPKEVVGVAPIVNSEPVVQEGGTEEAMVEMSELPVKVLEQAGEESGILAAAVAVDATQSTSATGGMSTEPLGVPGGEVDEIDNPAQTIHPLTATTSSKPLPPTPMSEQNSDNHVEEDADTARSSKRRKSIASIHDE